MIVQFGQPSPWQVGQSSRRLYSPRSVGIGTRPRRWAIISSKSGLTLSYSLPSSARIGPKWNSTSSIAIFGTSETRTRRRAFAYAGSVSSMRRRIDSGAWFRTFTFILDPPPPAASFRLRAVVRHRGDFLDPTDSKARAGQGPDGRLRSRAGRLRPVPAGRPYADVDRVDPLLLRGVGDALRGLHRRVGRGLVLRRLHDHAPGRLRDCLRSRDVGQSDDDVVVRRVDVGHSPSRHDHTSFGPGSEGGDGTAGSSPDRSGPSSSIPSEAGAPGIWPCCRTGCRSFEIPDRSSYAITFSWVRLTRIPGIVTRRPPTDTWPWTMNCRAWRGVKASPLRKVRVWRRRERTASTSSARTSSSVVPSSGKRPSRPRRRRSCSRSFSACLSPVRTRAWSSRARCRNRLRVYCERQSSFLFFNPYFFRSSFSALIRSASQGCDGRSNFARENFGSPNGSLLLLRRLLLFLLLFLLRSRLFRLLRLRGLEGGLLRHADRQARSAVRPRTLPADLLARLVAHALVRPDHLHQVDVVPQADFDLRTDEVQVEPRLPVLRAVHHPWREQPAEVAQGRLDLFRLLLRQLAQPPRPGGSRAGGDRLGHPAPDAGGRREGNPDGSPALQVRVRPSDDVAEVLFHAFELLRRPRRLRLLFLLVLLL